MAVHPLLLAHRPALPRDSAGARRILAAVLVATMLAGCTTLAPFEAAAPKADEHAICYNKLAATEAELRDLAGRSCASSVPPHVTSQEINLSTCPVLLPVRLTFTCAAP